MKQIRLTSIIIMFAALLAADPCAVSAPAALPSELLEQGIYAQETKGDLDAAIAIYQQLTAQAKVSQALAAQAQLRLGQCLLKKNRATDAHAAFEKLIRDFPGEKELIAKAREYLPDELALGPVPWPDGERLKLLLTFPTGVEIGLMELRADLVEAGGRKAWRVGRRMSGGGEMLSSVVVDAETFVPLTSYWKHTLLGEVSAAFKPGEVEMRRPGAAEPTMARPDKTVFDNEEVMHMMRRLPLQIGYKTNIPVITTLGGGTILPIGLEVPAKEMIETTVGNFDCFKTVLSVGQTFWISDDAHRYLVKFEAGGAIATLVTVGQCTAGTPVNFRDDELGVSLAAPADWVIHRQRNEIKGRAAIRLLDPAADSTHVALYLSKTDSLPANVRQSARAWAEHGFQQSAVKEQHGGEIRANSWKTCTIAGRPGVSFVADFQEMGKPMISLSLYAVGPKMSEYFVLACAAEKFEALKAAFDQIVAGYRPTK